MMILKNIFNTDRKLIFDVIIALVLGVTFGNFLGNRVINDDTIGVVADGYNDEIFLIQTGIYYDVVSANIALNELNKLDIESIVIQEHNKYYVYHGIATDESEFDELITLFDAHEIDYFIKSKQLYTLLEQMELDKDSAEYDFYHQTIEYYLILLRGHKVTLTDGYIDQVDDPYLNLFNNVQALNNNLDSKLTPKYELHTYKNLAEIFM